MLPTIVTNVFGNVKCLLAHVERSMHIPRESMLQCVQSQPLDKVSFYFLSPLLLLEHYWVTNSQVPGTLLEVKGGSQ